MEGYFYLNLHILFYFIKYYIFLQNPTKTKKNIKNNSFTMVWTIVGTTVLLSFKHHNKRGACILFHFASFWKLADYSCGQNVLDSGWIFQFYNYKNALMRLSISRITNCYLLMERVACNNSFFSKRLKETTLHFV